LKFEPARTEILEKSNSVPATIQETATQKIKPIPQSNPSLETVADSTGNPIPDSTIPEQPAVSKIARASSDIQADLEKSIPNLTPDPTPDTAQRLLQNSAIQELPPVSPDMLPPTAAKKPDDVFAIHQPKPVPVEKPEPVPPTIVPSTIVSFSESVTVDPFYATTNEKGSVRVTEFEPVAKPSSESIADSVAAQQPEQPRRQLELQREGQPEYQADTLIRSKTLRFTTPNRSLQMPTTPEPKPVAEQPEEISFPVPIQERDVSELAENILSGREPSREPSREPIQEPVSEHVHEPIYEPIHEPIYEPVETASKRAVPVPDLLPHSSSASDLSAANPPITEPILRALAAAQRPVLPLTKLKPEFDITEKMALDPLQQKLSERPNANPLKGSALQKISESPKLAESLRMLESSREPELAVDNAAEDSTVGLAMTRKKNPVTPLHGINQSINEFLKPHEDFNRNPIFSSETSGVSVKEEEVGFARSGNYSTPNNSNANGSTSNNSKSNGSKSND
jgi:hypothetical protein